MPINSKKKGKRGELELCQFLRDHGLDAERSVQYKGRADSADVICASLPHVHFENKCTERTDLYGWMEQAVADSSGHGTPVVTHKKNRKPFLAIMRLEDFLRWAIIVENHDRDPDAALLGE